MNITDPGSNGSSKNVFDLEEPYDKEILPLIHKLCEKAQEIGVPVFVVACYKSDGKGAWLASSACAREDFVPREFYVIRAVVEGVAKVVTMG